MTVEGGTPDDQQVEKLRSALLLAKRQVCFEHAGDLIKAAYPLQIFVAFSVSVALYYVIWRLSSYSSKG